MSNQHFNRLDNFSFDFVSLFNETNPTKLLKAVKEEMILDCHDIELTLKEIKDGDILLDYLVNYTSKYSYFIYHFEKLTMYEACADIRKLYKSVASTYFLVTDETLEKMMITSVDKYRELTNK